MDNNRQYELQENAFDALNEKLIKYDNSLYNKLDIELCSSHDFRASFESFLDEKFVNRDVALCRAYSLALYMMTRPLNVNEDDILVGKAEYRDVKSTYPAGTVGEIQGLMECGAIDHKTAEQILSAENMWMFFRVPGGHVIPNYSLLLKKGYEVLAQEIKDKLLLCNGEHRDFYLSELIVCRSAQEQIARYRNKVQEIAKTATSQNNRVQLEKIAQSCQRLYCGRPEHFIDAVQLVWFAHENLVSEGNLRGLSFGRMDQYLYPFYEEDINSGYITKEQVLKYLCALWNKMGFDQTSFNFQNITLGGSDSQGRNEYNELTLLMIDATLKVRANQPMLSLRVSSSMPQIVWEKAYECLQTGMGVPALFNDDIVVKSKIFSGVDRKDAYNYSIIGCVETSIGGQEYSHTEGMRINWLKVLELMFFEGTCPITGKHWELKEKHHLTDFLDFGSFLEWYKCELEFTVRTACKFMCMADIQYGEKWPVPYLSLLMDGCIEHGNDVTRGGTKYNNLCINFAGMSNTANSLIAIKKLVFEKRKISLNELPAILKDDFRLNNEIKNEILSYPKYGNDNNEVDMLLLELVNMVINIVQQYQVKRGGAFQAGFYTVWLHSIMGANMVASPDGRKSGFSLSSSLSPTQGTDISGPIAAFNSVTKLPLDKMANGMVFDIKFSRRFFSDMGVERFKSMVMAYFEKGGQELQMNVVNRDILIAAQKNPDEYRNLLVRVSGFSTYFVLLDKVLQDEIIMRYENESL